VIRAINAAGIGIRAEVNKSASGIVLHDTTGGSSNVIVANGDATNTADKLQLTVNAAQTSFDSGSLHRQFISRQTRLADYNGGHGVTAGKFVITDSDGATALIDTTGDGVETIGDVLDLINSAGIGVAASINDRGDGIRLVDTAGGSETLRVANGSHDTASDLRIVGDAEVVDIGGAPTQVIDGSTAVAIEISATDTLEDLVENLNASGLPLAANLFHDGSGTTPYRLSLTASESGSAGRLLIDTTAAGFALDEIVAAQDARLLFGSPAAGGIVASSSDNTFDDLIGGLSLTLGEPAASPVTISVTSTDTSIVSAVKTLVDQFNKLRDKIDTHTFFNEEDNSTGILFSSNET
ncbi:MAG: flagellar filament capping protein FliD, partial [Nitrospirae bacterium]|nr:flagellar filament capping protein FliD [Nitrospirota bacterium]